MNIGIDHDYYAIKTRYFSFPIGISEYTHEPYALQNTLEYGGKFYVCVTGRQLILLNKMENDNYHLLTLAAIVIYPELIQNEPSVLLMNIGGWTVDLMWLDKGISNASTCRSLELGMICCIDEMKEQICRDVSLSVTDAQVERVLAGKPCSMDEDARNSIQKQGRLYTERLLSATMVSGFDLKAIP